VRASGSALKGQQRTKLGPSSTPAPSYDPFASPSDRK
jgi:hypothetical protein